MADFSITGSFVDASYLDNDDFGSFMSSMNPDPDEPDYYQAKEDDFNTQSINIKEEKTDKSESESFDTSLLEQFRANVNETVVLRKQKEVEGKFGLQLFLPSGIYKLFEEEIQSLPPNIIVGGIIYVIFLIVLGVSLLFIQDNWIWGTILCTLVFLTSLLLGVIGCAILVNEVYQEVEEEQDFVAQVQGLGLWEVKKNKGVKINLNAKENTSEPKMDTGRVDTSEGLEIGVIAPGTLDYLLHRFKMQDPVRERQILVQGGLSFIWLAYASFIACGFLTAMSSHYPSKEEREINDIQTSLVGIAGWVVIAFVIACLFKRNSSS